MNWYKLFYWLTVAENAKTFFVVFLTIFTIICVIATSCYLVNVADSHSESGERMSRKWMWWSYPFAILFWALYIFTPNRKDSLLIIAGGGTMEFLTNDSTAKQIPHELSNFVVVQLKEMAGDAKIQLNIHNQKDKILDEAKKMSVEELMSKMKEDTTFAKVILNK
jgi:hypothetical protein